MEIKKIKNKLTKLMTDFKLSHFPINSFKPIHINNKAYFEASEIIDLFINKIVEEINAYKPEEKDILNKAKHKISGYNVLSKIGDYLGPVISFENKFFKCVKKESIDGFVALWNTGLLQVLSKKGFIPKIKISDFYTDEYPIILEQETISIQNIEKCTLFDSKRGLFFVSLLQSICRKVNCVLLDPHFYNYTICSNGTFKYFDIGSFKKVDNTKKVDDFSMVVLGAYRILFAYFPCSVLSRQELGEFRLESKNYDYSTCLHEFVFYRKHAYKFYKFHCSKKAVTSFKNIFFKNECSPIDVVACFLPGELEHMDELLSKIV